MQIFLHIYILCVIFFIRIFKASSVKLWSLDQGIATLHKKIFIYFFFFWLNILWKNRIYFIVVIIISFPCNEDIFLSYFIFISFLFQLQ